MADTSKKKKTGKAVALGHEPGADSAPMVLAKGSGYTAERIIELAKEKGVALHEDPALVEALSVIDIGREIPEELYRAVASALRGALGERSIVMCHLSHAYADGASLYFTFFARARAGEELEQWRAAKTAACEAIVATRGTITHHHAVGRDHAPYMPAEVGKVGIDEDHQRNQQQPRNDAS